MLTHRRRLAAVILGVALVVQACSNSSEPTASNESTATTEVGETTLRAETQEQATQTDEIDEVEEPTPVDMMSNPWEANARLAATLNLGGVLEVDRGETWGPDLALDDIDTIAAAGFTAVRVPVRWSVWADETPPFTIDDELHDRVDAVIERALANDLAVVLDVHHFELLTQDPEGQRERFMAIWRQIAERHADQPPEVIFEILNEPNTNLDGAIWNELSAEALGVIRESNPGRTVMIGPGNWYSVLELEQLELPDDDNLIASVHFYEPFRFTHQGATWVEGADQWTGTQWDGGEEDRRILADELALAGAWAEEQNVPMFVGEFGALIEADSDDRLAWVAFVRQTSEAEGFAWGYWDWATFNFGVYDNDAEAWNEDLLAALFGS